MIWWNARGRIADKVRDLDLNITRDLGEKEHTFYESSHTLGYIGISSFAYIEPHRVPVNGLTDEPLA